MPVTKKNKIIIFLIVLVTLCVLPFAIFIFGYMILPMAQMEIRIRLPYYYKNTAQDLASLVSHLDYSDEIRTVRAEDIGYSWYPEVIEKLEPMYVMLLPKIAIVSVGGGFWPLWYSIRLNEEKSNDDYEVWDLYICSESLERKKYSVQLSKNDNSHFEKLVKRAINNYDQKILQSPESTAHQKHIILFLILFKHPEQALQSCQNAIEKFPNHGWFRLASAYLISQTGQYNNAENEFTSWVENNASLLNYFYLSYFCYVNDDLTSFLEASEKAINFSSREKIEAYEQVCNLIWNLAKMAYEKDQNQFALEILSTTDKNVYKYFEEYKNESKTDREAMNKLLDRKYRYYCEYFDPFFTRQQTYWDMQN